ncbi:D-serine deaminase-like pyridoxal phosphate-dependent protein [Kushneria sinocarnis]|uniref:D-serine deaminase-like pyridoxal phosphate-dependent protein n=1 Tax=Kushneria sinocarnis TaxID=595502 RepID=A0A420X0J0_9GAMM|nr:amino acid deaminase [Kushneria sinocarnis]RKR07366.1 D-serine deaminase-like pyridoxal phosphate-dependent protein [Kushneria sinocarnis]
MQPLSFPEKGALIHEGRSLLTDVSLPAAVIDEGALAHNLAWMQRFADHHGAKLAPHGKTTMTPALFRRQLEAGAWGITLATATQCVAAFAHGVSRLLMANQLVGRPNMALIADIIERGAQFYCVVDGIANVQALGAFFAERGLTLPILIELGTDGGRCGVRNERELDALVAAIAGQPALALAGVEGYEGVIGDADPVAAVRAYGERLVATVMALRESGALAVEAPIVTASGSKWFDLIAEAFDRADLRNGYTPVLRPGCYVVHDHRLYRRAMAEVRARHPELQDELRPALSVFAHVQSLPEPGLAIVALGKRDISCDPDLPLALAHYRDGHATAPVSEWQVTHIMDQHVFVTLPAHADIAVGDVIAFGASHPCLTFDKWRQLLRVDDRLNVLDTMPTLF